MTARDPRGPWSEPVFLNRSGFDPSLFHDDDGRAYLVNMYLDYEAEGLFFAGILLQEYSKAERRLVGPITNIFRGTEAGATEGPHLMKRDGRYYLICAEGGTGYGHQLTMARANAIAGPYEVHPDNPIMTARETDLPIQKAGHGNLVDTPSGQWYGVFLCGRPMGRQRCVLGRETAIERGRWDNDGWFRFDSPNPRVEVPAPELPEAPVETLAVRDDFDAPELALCWNTLRMPHGDEVSLSARAGHLRLVGQPYPIETNNRQALVARRVEHRDFDAATVMEFAPENTWHSAGLTCFYCHMVYYWLRVTRKPGQGVVVEVIRRYGNKRMLLAGIAADDWPRYFLRVTARDDAYQFAASRDGQAWTDVGEPQDGSILSDEVAGKIAFAFTGAYVGVACRDVSCAGKHADFDWFDYEGR